MVKTKCRCGIFFENIYAKPLPEFHHALLVTGRAKVTAFTREGKQVFMAAAFTLYTGKTIAQISAIQVTIR